MSTAGRRRLYSTVTCVFTEFAMKQISWAWRCRRSSSSLVGGAPAHSIFGRSLTLVTASRPGAMSSDAVTMRLPSRVNAAL